ncbi:MAG: Dabb family protein [Gemmataceae bacterium]|nr:Dabb family protein [Gemmataceae bacterium]
MTALLLAATLAAPADDPKPAAGTPKPVASDPKPAAPKAEPKIGHMVYFKLKDSTPEAREKLVAACDKYLGNHEGVLLYAAGPISDELKSPVGDREWDVALHLVFENKAAHDKYDAHPDHKKFIEENKDGWAKVRVFDSAPKSVKAAPMRPGQAMEQEMRKRMVEAMEASRRAAEEQQKKMQAEMERMRREIEAARKKAEEKKPDPKPPAPKGSEQKKDG